MSEMSEMPQMSFSTIKVFITHLKVNEVFQNDGQKSKDCFRSYENVFDKFPETWIFIDKVYREECSKENFSVEQVFLTLIIILNIFLCYGVMLLYGL